MNTARPILTPPPAPCAEEPVAPRPQRMPLQNRVTPEGEIIATSARGTLMGNRGGKFHTPDKHLKQRRWSSKTWIACRLVFRDRWREVMGQGYTELFFLDEATSLAAGHRPCFECRRAEASNFLECWSRARGFIDRARAAEMDEILHAERILENGSKPTFEALFGDLPTGAFVQYLDAPHLVLAGRLLKWTPEGYRDRASPDASLKLDVLTPASTVAAILAGYSPDLHASALEHL